MALLKRIGMVAALHVRQVQPNALPTHVHLGPGYLKDPHPHLTAHHLLFRCCQFTSDCLLTADSRSEVVKIVPHLQLLVYTFGNCNVPLLLLLLFSNSSSESH